MKRLPGLSTLTLVFRIKRGAGIIGENKKRVGRKQTKKKECCHKVQLKKSISRRKECKTER